MSRLVYGLRFLRVSIPLLSKPHIGWKKFRCPHAENKKGAGASFLVWGGGGGCAEDEADARAMGASAVVSSNVA